MDETQRQLLDLTQRLLETIAQGDWDGYEKLCDPGLTAFEPEAHGQLVEGMDFHHFYFRLGGARGPHQTTICSPRVRVWGDSAVVSYVRLNQRIGPSGTATVSAFEETRIWQRQPGGWKHVHFHRSAINKAD